MSECSQLLPSPISEGNFICAYSAPAPILLPPFPPLPFQELLFRSGLFPHLWEAESGEWAERNQTRGKEVQGKRGEMSTFKTLGLGNSVLEGGESRVLAQSQV